MTDDEMKKQMYQTPPLRKTWFAREDELHNMRFGDICALYAQTAIQMGLPAEQEVWQIWQMPNLVDRLLRLEAHQGSVLLNYCARCGTALTVREYPYNDALFCHECHPLVAFTHLSFLVHPSLPFQYVRGCIGYLRQVNAIREMSIPISGNLDEVTCITCLNLVLEENNRETGRIERAQDVQERKRKKALRAVNAKKFGDKPNRMERREELWKMPIAEFISLANGHSGIRLGSWKNILAPLQTRTLEKDESKRLKGTVKELLHIEPIGVVIEKMVNYETSCAYLEDVDFVCRVCHTKVYGHASRTRSSKKLISRELFIAFAHLRLCVLCATKMMMTDAMQEGVLVGIDKALEDGEVRPKGSG